MSDERPETCNKCGAPVVWCNCEVCDLCGHDPTKSQMNENYLRGEIEILRGKLKIIRGEVVRRWNNIAPKWLMEELDR